MELQLKYGIDKETGKSRYIYEVERGLSCNCKCPICDQDLVAKQGTERIPHFAHYFNESAECRKGSCMSMLHRLAQEVIQEESKVMLPEYSKKYVQRASKLQSFDSVTLEEVCKDEVSRRRPDCIGRPFNNTDSLWIEIFCCNPIKMDREEDIKRKKQYCIEIDLSDLLETEYTKDIVRERLLSNSKDRRWVCHSEWDEEEKLKEEEAKRQQEEAAKREREESIRIQEEEERKQAELLQNQRRVPESDTFTFIQKTENETKPINSEKRDWVMYAKTIYWQPNALDSFFKLLRNEYTKVTLENSHPFVADEVFTKSNQLLPRTQLIEDVNKTYLKLLLTIWVLDRLNHKGAIDYEKLFVENQNVRNDIFRFIKRIGNINSRQIEETFVPTETENRDVILQILRTCYMK